MTKFLLSFTIFVLCSYILITKTLDEPRNLTHPPKIETNQTISDSNVESVSISDEVKLSEVLVSDMADLKHLSEIKKYEIAQHIVEMGETYNISPLLIYAFLKTESNINNNVTHKPVYTKTLNKKIQAIGMGGVVWEFWEDELVFNTSLNKKTDLKDYKKNIEATAYIVSYIYQNRKLHKQAKNPVENVAIWYYGLPNVEYIEKINHHYQRLL